MTRIEEAADRCIQCGFCLQACPTYRLFDSERSSPRGRIALVKDLLKGELQPTDEVLATFSECLGCRACESACPSGVHYEEILMYGREKLHDLGQPVPWHAALLLATIRSPRLLALAGRLWRLLGRVVIRLARLVPASSGPFALLAALPDPARPGRVREAEQAEVVVHRGCLMDLFWERTNARAVELLNDRGKAARLLPQSVGCCGALHGHQGDLEGARVLARRVIEAFEASGASTIVNLAGGCSAFIKEYPDLFPDDDPWQARAKRVAAAVKDMASLLAALGYRLEEGAGVVTYQDSCHLRHGLKVWREPRLILRTSGAYRELPSAAECCGSAGIYNLLRPDVSSRILAGKVEELRGLGATTLVTSNPGCELEWRMGVRQGRVPVDVVHLVDHVYEHRASALRGEEETKGTASGAQA
jgi:glycolate oxidase iron-sulfur subunit